jgi:hypothetical protein
VAVRPQDLKVVSEALGTEFELVFCHSLAEAKAALNEDIGLIVCGVRFDEGQMLDLLRYVNGNAQTRSFPFFCIIGAGRAFASGSLEAIKQAVLVLGANEIVDLIDLRHRLGEAQAYETLREAIRKVLARASVQ